MMMGMEAEDVSASWGVTASGWEGVQVRAGTHTRGWAMWLCKTGRQQLSPSPDPQQAGV